MTRKPDSFMVAASALWTGALILPFSQSEKTALWDFGLSGPLAVICLLTCLWLMKKNRLSGYCKSALLLGLSIVVSVSVAFNIAVLQGQTGPGFWAMILAVWAMVWRGIDQLANIKTLNRKIATAINLIIPVLFGCWLFFLWQIIVTGFQVPQVLLPPPSMIWARFITSLDILGADFYQTFMKAVLAGYVLGSGTGFVIAIAVDRSDFLKKGMLPVGNLISALPIVGIAPIMVMWFGFDWQSKAAVVVIMTFFPMLVNTVSGLGASGKLERDLMNSYGAGYWQTLFKLRLPAAMPFVFNALKINSTLALIGAIVAEFFGTPIVGMGFRISTEVGRMNVDMVWAEILMAAIAGTVFYGLMALLERMVTFWHPSYRHKN